MHEFKSYGHKNITAKHKNTLEFTKDRSLTINGDCIVGVRADFSLPELKKFKDKIKITIKAGNIAEEVNAEVNSGFDDNHELVIRKSDYKDKRTFAVRADKAAVDFNKELVNLLSDSEQEIDIIIS